MQKRVLVLQAGIITLCLIALIELVVRFPLPSPLIEPFLPPQLRWPAAEVAAWVEAQNYDPGFLEYFYRDPKRTVPPGQNLVSPADGVLRDVVFKDAVTYFIVALSFWDVHVVRTPVAGVVKNITSEGFAFYRDSSEVKDQVYLKGKAGPVQQVLTLDTDYGEVRVRLITSYWASRLKVWVHEGDRLSKGQRIGRILLGSSVVAEFPGNVKFTIPLQQRVVGGETVIFNGEHFQ
jgi:phosphatidylserine decarboxylase